MRYENERFTHLLHEVCLEEAEYWVSDTVKHYTRLLSERCESPIERLLGAAMLSKLGFLSLGKFHDEDNQTRFFCSSGKLWLPSSHVWNDALRYARKEQCVSEIVALVPQCRVEGHRADFALAIQGVADPDFDHDFRPSYPTEVRTLVVECDGHEFHERTSRQAARDRSWDRAMQRAGIGILRFTGSEIVASPHGCAEEVGELIRKWVIAERRRYIPAIGETLP